MAGYPSATDFAPSGGRGGFIASPANDSPTQKTFRAADQQTMTPVCVRMLVKAQQGSDDVFRLDGQPLVQVTFVGKVVGADTSNATNVTYKVDDGSGVMEVKMWLESDDQGMTQAKKAEEVNTYIRVYGHLRQWNKTLNVVAFRILAVMDANEISYHFLEVIRVHLQHTKGSLPPADAHSGATITPIKGTQPAASISAAAPATNATHGADVSQDVLSFIRLKARGDRGIARQEIVAALSGTWTAPRVAQAIGYLVADGQIFTTSDDDHFNVD